MHITVKAFAHLRDRLGADETPIELAEASCVADAWRAVSGEDAMPKHVFAAVNREYARPGDRLHENDEVAFFPPVTGG